MLRNCFTKYPLPLNIIVTICKRFLTPSRYLDKRAHLNEACSFRLTVKMGLESNQTKEPVLSKVKVCDKQVKKGTNRVIKCQLDQI